jgi:protein SCO1/2
MLLVLLVATAGFSGRPQEGRSEPGPEPAGTAGDIGVTEQAGSHIPPGLVCRDEAGREFSLDSRLDRPVILSLVYYSCMHICPQVLVALGELVQKMDLRPEADYRLLTLSFDENDGPDQAEGIRHNYLKPLGDAFPAEGWTFATASPDVIRRLTEAVGFRARRVPHGFIHPVILVVIGPGGLISSYVRPARFNYGVAYPIVFREDEMKERLAAAAKGETSASPRNPVLFCFPMEPAGQVVFERMSRTAGWVTLAVLGGLFAYLAGARRRNKEVR